MVETKTKSNNYQFFFWESYLIDYRKNILKAMKNNENKKNELLIELTLMDFFIKRIKIDPGFYGFVSKQCIDDPGIFNLLSTYLYSLFYENGTYKTEYISKLFGLTTDNSNIEINDLNFDYQINEMEKENSAPAELIAKLKYLSYRLKNAINTDNDNEIKIIDVLLNEYFYNRGLIHQIFDNGFYDGTTYTEGWDYESKRYAFEKIKFLEIYRRSDDNDFIFKSKDFTLPVEAHMAVLASLKRLPFGAADIGRLSNDYVTDLVRVCLAIWFNQKDTNEKLSILNKNYNGFDYYPFSGDFTKKKSDVIDTLITEFGGLDELSQYLNYLITYGFIDECNLLTKLCINKKWDKKNYPYDLIRNCYYHAGDAEIYKEKYPIALNDFFNMIKIIKKSEGDNSINLLLPYLKISFIYYILPDEKLSERYFNMFFEHTKKMDKVANNINYTLFELKNSAQFCCDMDMFEQEYDILILLKKFYYIFLDNDFKIKLHNRLKELESCSTNGKISSDTLIKQKNNKLYQKYASFGEHMFYSFQFDNALFWFGKAAKIREDNNVLGWFGIIYYYNGNLPKSREIFEKMIKVDDRENDANTYLALFNALENRIDESISNLSKIIAIRKIQHFALYNYLSPPKKDKKYTIHDVFIQNVSVFIKEMVNFGRLELSLELLERAYDSITGSFIFEKAQFHQDIATILTDFGFFDTGKDYYNKSLSENPSKDLECIIYLNLGSNYANRNLHKDALDNYTISIRLLPSEDTDITGTQYPDRSILWQNKSVSHQFLGEYEEALISMKFAINYYSKFRREKSEEELRSWKSREKLLEYFKENNVKLNLIPDAEDTIRMKNILLSAESLTFNIERYLKVKKFDFSLALVEYGKFLESMLHYNISLQVKKIILNKYGNPQKDSKNRNTNYLWIPHPLYDLLMYDNRTITLGQWHRLLQDIEEKEYFENSLLQEFKIFLEIQFSKSQLEVIKKASEKISDYRNGSAHLDSKTKEEVLEKRKIIIQHLNNVIVAIYKK